MRLVILCLAVLILNCGKPTVTQSPVNFFVDDTGYKIELNSTPRRVVSMAPSLTEVIAAIGCESSLVGVTLHCDFPESVKALPKGGSYVRPNIEAIVAMKPDLVLVVMEGPPKESVEQMRALGLNVAALKSATIGDVAKNIRWIGAILDADSNAEKVATEIERKYNAVKAVIADLPRPKTLYVIALDPVITAGPGSFIHELIGDAGGKNVAGDLDRSYPRMSLEAVIDRAPDAIIFSTGMGSVGGAAAQMAHWKRWPAIPAVKSGRLLEIDAELIDRPSPRIVAGLAELASLIHPEKRGEIERIK